MSKIQNSKSNLIEEDFKRALKSRDELLISTLRLLKSALHNLEIEKQHPLTDEEIWQLVNKEINQRKEAILEYQKGKREDLAKKEEKELKILSLYLPVQLKEAEIKKLIIEAVKATKATGPSDMGKVMGAVMPKVKGKAEGSKVAQLVKEELVKRR